MPGATHSLDAAGRDFAYDLLRGIAVYTGSGLVGRLARVVAKHPEADIATAFNRKQVACKLWARDRLFDTFGGRYQRVLIVGGWYGVMAALLLEDRRFDLARVASVDIDPKVAAVARTLVGEGQGRFEARAGDMYGLDYGALGADLVINTSCEHIADFKGWLGLLPPDTRVLLQSNDYFSEPSHVSSMPSLAAFIAAAGLSDLRFSDQLPQQTYTRFMLIGTV
jgi:SAM-dependent methyltransferase